MTQILFHLAFPVKDISSTKKFYIDGLGCLPGRENDQCLILSLYGHQLVAHVVSELPPAQKGIYPRHFGVVFQAEASWLALLERLHEKRVAFHQRPKVRFPDTPLEHRTFFLQDPSGNFLEFKYYRFESAVFGETSFHQVGEEEVQKRSDKVSVLR